jgi:ribosomal protein L32
MLTLKKHKTPDHLKVLGIAVCSDCGSLLSIDNTTCYNCGFDADDDQLNEDMLNNKYIKQWNNNGPHYLAKTKDNGKLHIYKDGNLLCGNLTHHKTNISLLGELNRNRLSQFLKNPCYFCKNRLGQ